MMRLSLDRLLPFETLQWSKLKNYRVGVIIHVILQNRIDFITDPQNSRSFPHSSEISKTLIIPIIHANGEFPRPVVKILRMVIEYRQTFKKDIFVTLYASKGREAMRAMKRDPLKRNTY